MVRFNIYDISDVSQPLIENNPVIAECNSYVLSKGFSANLGISYHFLGPAE